MKSLSRVFQALRIAVNQELEVLERVLGDGVMLLKPGGRMAVISYHSLEDRMVKRFFFFSDDGRLGPERGGAEGAGEACCSNCRYRKAGSGRGGGGCPEPPCQKCENEGD